MKKIIIFLIFSFLLINTVSYAGITGKIAGRITDASNNQGLAGVNVVIEGELIGAATDMKGYYTILNVPPGTYSLKASIVGYTNVTVKNVKVVIDLTTRINIEMSMEVLDMEEVVVVAERPVVTKDVSASQMNVTSKTIESLPVQKIDQVLTLQAGIRGDLIVRGSSSRQTTFMVDGVSLNDERSNTPYMGISLSSIKDVQIQTGGFNAEYGNVRGGVINVVAKEGDRDRYSGTISYLHRPPGKKHFGPDIYSSNTYFTRPFTDPAVCWTGTANGNWDDYTRRQYPEFEGWNAVSLVTLQDDDPTNDLTPEGAKRLWEWQHRRTGDITKPDINIDAGFGGPVPFISKKLGNLRFFASHRSGRTMFIYPLSRDSYDENNTQLKLVSDITTSMKLILTGMYGEIHSVSPYQWKTTPTGDVLNSDYEVADLVNKSSGNSMLYMPGYFSPSSVYRSMFSAKFTHVLSPKTFYEINLKHNINRYNTFKLADRDTSAVYQPVPGYFVDEAPYGYWGYGSTGIDGMSLGGWMNLGRDNSVNKTTMLRFDYTSQVDNRNQVKTGFEFVYNDYNIKSITESPSMTTWTRSMIYQIFPFRVGAYVQDKLEFEGFIANLGFRMDYSDPNGDWYDLSIYDELFKEGFGDDIEAVAPQSDTEAQFHISPRLGISHPITEQSKLYFNYGHFYQEPASSYRFRIQREYNGLVTDFGNPNMKLEKTVAYELGYAHSIFDLFLVNIAAYYKDITNQPNWIYYEDINGAVQYYKAGSNNYEDIRGFELTLTKRSGDWITGFINYTYEAESYGYFGYRRYYEDQNEQDEYLLLNPPYQVKPLAQPYARASIDIHTPANFGPRWLGIKPLEVWNLNILAEWRAGEYDTYNPNSIPGVINDVQWRDYHNIDMRLSKTFKVSRYEFQFYVDVSNVFNAKHMSYAGFSDYNGDYLDYLKSLRFSWEQGSEKGNDRVGDYRDPGVAYEPYDPTDPTKTKKDLQRILDTKAYIDMPNLTYFAFLNPRDFKFGLKINF